MARSILAVLFILSCFLGALGCSGGEVTHEQQDAKRKALQKVADESGEPVPEKRPG